jgi:NhaP-type Na+/H+ or K+/H+ antiporter
VHETEIFDVAVVLLVLSALLALIDFSEVLLQVMLSMLLFAGAPHVDLSELKAVRWQVGILAAFGTVASIAIVGLGMRGGCHSPDCTRRCFIARCSARCPRSAI